MTSQENNQINTRTLNTLSFGTIIVFACVWGLRLLIPAATSLFGSEQIETYKVPLVLISFLAVIALSITAVVMVVYCLALLLKNRSTAWLKLPIALLLPVILLNMVTFFIVDHVSQSRNPAENAMKYCKKVKGLTQ